MFVDRARVTISVLHYFRVETFSLAKCHRDLGRGGRPMGSDRGGEAGYQRLAAVGGTAEGPHEQRERLSI